MIDDVKPVVSERKKAANRANAQKSTGPKTAEGKARSRLNAVTHGLCAVVIEIPGEDRELLEKRVRGTTTGTSWNGVNLSRCAGGLLCLTLDLSFICDL